MTNSSDQEPVAITPDKIGDLFFNERGEVINRDLELFIDPINGSTWREWGTQYLPVAVYREFGMVEVEGSDEWLNVVEHNVFVAAVALTIGEKLVAEGVSVDLEKLVKSAIVHDASKRLDIERKLSRTEEVTDKTFETVVKSFGYSDEEITAAKNTGRLPDRYIDDPVVRLRAIADHSIEANIVGYADARTRNVHLLTLENAMNDSITSKPKDEEFFTRHWRPYYDAVERYFQVLAPGFDPEQITDWSVLETVKTASTTQ